MQLGHCCMLIALNASVRLLPPYINVFCMSCLLPARHFRIASRLASVLKLLLCLSCSSPKKESTVKFAGLFWMRWPSYGATAPYTSSSRRPCRVVPPLGSVFNSLKIHWQRWTSYRLSLNDHVHYQNQNIQLIATRNHHCMYKILKLAHSSFASTPQASVTSNCSLFVCLQAWARKAAHDGIVLIMNRATSDVPDRTHNQTIPSTPCTVSAFCT